MVTADDESCIVDEVVGCTDETALTNSLATDAR